MTLKEFEAAKQEKDKKEFECWFEERARWSVRLGGILHPCIKVTSKKIASKNRVCICDECVNLCDEILEEEYALEKD